MDKTINCIEKALPSPCRGRCHEVTDEVNNFKKALIASEKSKNTIEKYIKDCLDFLEWLGDRKIEKEVLRNYKEKLIKTYSARSVNSKISSLNCFFEFLGLTDFKLKTIKIQRSIYASSEKELTKAEYERLLSAAKNDKRLYYLIQTICSSGIRVSELKFITFEALEQGYAIINNKGKMRKVFLPKTLCVMLKRYAKEKGIKNGSIFVTRNNKPLDRSNIWKMLKGLCEKARVSKERVFPHNLRHLFARTFYKIHKDIVRLADILGHSSINTTRIYTMETGEIHKQQIQKLGLLRC